MESYAVGSVPYLNAKPLIKPLLWDRERSRVQVHLDVPSKLPAMLEGGTTQAILVSSISALMDPGATVASGLSISTQNKVLSVRLFSRVPFGQIRTFAEDASSLTSNALAKILLDELFGVEPQTISLPPDGTRMLRECDACVMIGDNGMRYSGEGMHVLDLGEAWHSMTGLPFVWAVWKGGADLDRELVGMLRHSLERARFQMGRVIEEAANETGFSLEDCRFYLEEIMDYRLGDAHLKGLEKFASLLKDHRILEKYTMPKLVEPSAAAATV